MRAQTESWWKGRLGGSDSVSPIPRSESLLLRLYTIAHLTSTPQIKSPNALTAQALLGHPRIRCAIGQSRLCRPIPCRSPRRWLREHRHQRCLSPRLSRLCKLSETSRKRRGGSLARRRYAADTCSQLVWIRRGRLEQRRTGRNDTMRHSSGSNRQSAILKLIYNASLVMRCLRKMCR
jgi:hypothetical protein